MIQIPTALVEILILAALMLDPTFAHAAKGDADRCSRDV